MEDFVTAGQVILQVFGALVIIGGGLRYISDWMKPHKEFEQKVISMEKKQNEDYKRLNKIEKTLNAQSALLIEISNHLINGNHKDRLQAKSDELFECITKGE